MSSPDRPSRERYKAARYARRHPAAAAMRAIAAKTPAPRPQGDDTKDTDQ